MTAYNVDLKRVSTRVLLSAFEFFYKIVYIQYAQKMASISWFERDVVPQKMAMIDHIPQMGGGYQLPKTRLTKDE